MTESIIETRDEYVPDGEPSYGDSVLERAKQAAASEIKAGDGCDERFVAECVVRAVLQAIREPSEGMVKAGRATEHVVAGEVDWEGARPTWQAMIDAALEEG